MAVHMPGARALVAAVALLGLLAISAVGVRVAAGGSDEQVTRLTIEASGCDGCRIGILQAVEGRRQVWQTKPRTVTDGRVVFDVPTVRTHGLRISVSAPWQRSLTYVTSAAVRYRGQAAGEAVDLRTARAQTHASGCWAGTDRARATLHLHARKVPVREAAGTADGTVAWMSPQVRSWSPMEPVAAGVLGGQAVTFCARR